MFVVGGFYAHDRVDHIGGEIGSGGDASPQKKSFAQQS